jgi:uncharacterized iron-regulated membrane protein
MLSRRALHFSHKTLGLGLALLFMLQAISGAALVFREELLVAVNRQLLAVSQSTAAPALERILLCIDERFSKPAVERVVLPHGQRTAAMVYLEGGGWAGRRVVASDPVSGIVLGEITGVGLLPFVLFRIHDELLLGDVGHAISLLEGAVLLYLVVAGVFMARPRLQNALRVRWRGSKLQRRFDLHRAAGLSFSAFLVFTAMTGVALQTDFLATTAGISTTRLRLAAVRWSVLTPHVRKLMQDYPAGAVEEIRISQDSQTATILVRAQDVMRPLALDRLEVNLVTGQSAPMQRAADVSPGRSFLSWMYPLHTGKALGWLGAVLAVISALGLISMPVLGFLLWRAKPVEHRMRGHASSVRNG